MPTNQPNAFSGINLYQTDILERDSKGKFTGKTSWVWMKQFQQAAAQLLSPVTKNFPVTSADTAALGQLATDGTYLYVATGVNQWKRIALSSF